MTGLVRREAPTEPVVSLDEMKAHLNIEHDEKDDLIRDYIDAAVAMLDGADGELQRCLAPQGWSYVLDEWPESEDGSGAFEIPLPPLLEVEAIRYIDTDGDEQTLMGGIDYRVDTARQPGWVTPVEGWPPLLRTINAVTVDFRAGYESDGSSGNSPIPPTIRHAVRMLVGHWWENREASSERAPTEVPLGAQRLIQLMRIFA